MSTTSVICKRCAAVQLESIDIRIESTGDNNIVILQCLRDHIGIQRESKILSHCVEVLNLGGENSVGHEIDEDCEVVKHHTNTVLNISLKLRDDQTDGVANCWCLYVRFGEIPFAENIPCEIWCLLDRT